MKWPVTFARSPYEHHGEQDRFYQDIDPKFGRLTLAGFGFENLHEVNTAM